MKDWEIISCVKVTPQNYTALKNALATRPVMVSLHAEHMDKKYSEGVYKYSNVLKPLAKCPTTADSWMLMVGYGYDSKEKKHFWKLKNQLGVSWGVSGYVNIVRDEGKDETGECGIMNTPYIPI